MMSVRVVVFVILAVKGLGYVRADCQWKYTSPRRFIYKDSDKFYNTYIRLLNIPAGANHYVLYYGAEDPAEIFDMLPRNGRIRITKPLNEDSVTLDFQLISGSTVCAVKKIMDGKRNMRADEVDDNFRTRCLKHNACCEIIVDFESTKCQGNTPAKIQCRHQKKSVTCESPDETWPENTVHQWYQRYDNGYIGIIPPVKGNKSKFKITLRLFDYNSIIFRTINANVANETTEEFRIPFPVEGRYDKYTVIDKRTYSKSERVNFTCQNHAHAQIGWIAPTGYTITTYDKTSISWSFNKTNNGSMLCCVRYNNYYEKKHKHVVERLIEDITILIYEEPVNQDNADNDSSEESTSSSITTNSTTPRVTITGPIQNNPVDTLQTASSTDPQPTPNPVTHQPDSAQDQAPSENPQTPNKTEPPSGDDNPPNTNQVNGSPHSTDKTNYYIAIASVAAIILFISLIYVIVKKCSRKTLDPEETLELETYASNMVYAELDIRPGNQAPAPTTDDTTYAEIIGVLKPLSENVMK